MPAKSLVEHWQARIKPMCGDTVSLPFERYLDAAAMLRAQAGLIPQDTDERWFALCLEGEIALCRAHSGHQIYRLPLRRADAAGGFVAGPLEVIADEKIYRPLGAAFDLRTATLLLNRLTAE